jgi:hypothetical protein
MFCPSDPNSPKTKTDAPYRQGFHSNYLGNGGLGSVDPSNLGYPGSGDPRGLFGPQSKVRIADITDGTSNTLMLGEILVVPDTSAVGVSGSSSPPHDDRGRIYNSWSGNNFFSTYYQPNVNVADYAYWCQNVTFAPCTSSTTSAFITLRSRHPGGVNAALGDGTVRFVSNNVNQTAYQQAGTRNGGEVPGDF